LLSRLFKQENELWLTDHIRTNSCTNKKIFTNVFPDFKHTCRRFSNSDLNYCVNFYRPATFLIQGFVFLNFFLEKSVSTLHSGHQFLSYSDNTTWSEYKLRDFFFCSFLTKKVFIWTKSLKIFRLLLFVSVLLSVLCVFTSKRYQTFVFRFDV
jgi:hypothetical protein